MIETEDIRLSQERLAALKELLTPIKDVAKSWNVDISSELEKYMSQFGDNLNSENFAEAALVIQGSAGVWGKKVDYLFSLVVDSKTIIDKNKEKKNKSTDEREEDDEAEDEMMVLPPFQVKKATNPFIDLDSVCVSRHWKPNLPLCLSAASVKNDNPENMLYNKKGELLASIDDFFMHRIAAYDRNGFASIDIDSYHMARKYTDKAAVTPFYKRRVSQFNSAQDHQANPPEAEFNAAGAVSVAGEIEMNEDIPQSDDPGYPDDPGDPGGALDLDDESDGDVDPPGSSSIPNPGINEPKTPMHGISLRSNPQLPMQSIAPAQQKVHLLDPYEEVPSKPFKKGTITKPRTSSKRKTQTTSDSSLFHFLQNNSKPARPTNFYNILRKPIYPENTELFKKLRKKEASHANRMKKKITRQPRPVLLPDDLFKPPTIIEQSDDDHHDIGAGEDDFADTVFDNPQLGEDPGPSNNLEYLENQQEEELRASVTQPVVSYEDLVRQNVLKFTQEAGNRYRASELRTRVIEWENRITPLLEEEEKDPPFDVCIYSNKVISKLSSCADEQATLKDLVLGESKGEVCRLFLTSLMLTNSSNIELLGSDDEAKCKLISRTLFSDVLEGYVASETDATGSSNRKRKNLPP